MTFEVDAKHRTAEEEHREFVQYLWERHVSIDVLDAATHMLYGTAKVPLYQLLRQEMRDSMSAMNGTMRSAYGDQSLSMGMSAQKELVSVATKSLGSDQTPYVAEIVDPVHFKKLGALELVLTNASGNPRSTGVKASNALDLPVQQKTTAPSKGMDPKQM